MFALQGKICHRQEMRSIDSERDCDLQLAGMSCTLRMVGAQRK